MSKIAVVEVIVPDHIKPDDDVFNYMRSNTCRMKVTDFKDNPADLPSLTMTAWAEIIIEARGAEDAVAIMDDINNAIISVKNVKGVRLK